MMSSHSLYNGISTSVAADHSGDGRLPPEDMFPPSFAQEAFWFLDQMETDSSFYNLNASLRLKGRLDRAALLHSLDAVIQRHEVLRTSFVAVAGRPMQAIAAHLAVPFRLCDLSALEEQVRERTAQWLAIQIVEKPFDLRRMPLLHTQLLQLAPDEHVLVVTFPHIIMDRLSLLLFLRDLGTFYTAFITEESVQLPELPLQYADYAAWQRELLQGDVLEQQLVYWRTQLSGANSTGADKLSTVLELPSDHARPAVLSHRGAWYTAMLAPQLREALHALSRREGVTLFMTLLAAFVTLLMRYSGQDDILIGIPIVGRSQVELENVLGLFANTLVLRTDLSGDPSFRTLLKRVRSGCLGAYEHQDMPFEQLLELLKPERSLRFTPFFQVLFALQNLGEQPFAFAGLEASITDEASATARYDLTCDLLDTPNGIVCRWEYNTDLFEATTIARMAAHFQTLLTGVVADPQQHLSHLPLLSNAEQQTLLVQWNATEHSYPHNQCLHTLFEAQVCCTPDAIALVYENHCLSYAMLNSRANALALYLRTWSVAAEYLVGLYLERSIDMLVGMLGILKAGGAYVPLDPAYPKERLTYIAQNSCLVVLLTQHRLLEQLPAYECPVICIDTHWETIAQAVAAPSMPLVQPDNLAYVIYTSGSTGQPKGVQIPHQAVVNFMSAMQQQPGIHSADVLLAVTSLSFDIAALELFLPLVVGARVEVVNREIATNGLQLAERLHTSGATILQATPSTWRMLIGMGWNGTRALKMLCGGEALPRDLAITLRQRGSTLWNMYGPTETTIWSTVQAIQDISDQYALLPIGSAIANTQLYVLDAQWQLVPVGVPGELYIGGDGLARGYFQRPDLTAARFVPHPFSTLPGQRLYNTGDRVRYHADGTLEYLGRVDYQIKLRGYRIELGEIEAVLRQQPAIAEVVVVVREEQPDDRCLVAYIVPQAGYEPPTATVLYQALHKHLPDYMLPAAFVSLTALPLTPNGKINRHALPAPTRAGTQQDTPVATPPRTRVENILATIWARVLELEQVGIHDNFFSLRGDSIHSVQIVAQAAEAGIVLSPQQLFQHQTIAQLATVAEQAGFEEADEEGTASGLIPLTPAQRRFFALQLPEPHQQHQTLLLEVKHSQEQPLQLQLLEQAIRAILAQHDALRLRFTPSTYGWQQHVASVDQAVQAGIVRLIDVGTRSAHEQQEAIALETAQTQASLNLTLGPLLRVVLFRFGGASPERLLLVSHQLVVDSFSWHILVEDLETAYQQLARGETVQLPTKTTSFKTWAERLPEGTKVDASSNIQPSARHIQQSLSIEETLSLRHEVLDLYHLTIEETLLAASVQACASWVGAYRLLVAVEWYERPLVTEGMNLSRTVGWLSSPVPIALDLEAFTDNMGLLTVDVALKAVKEQVRYAIAALSQRGVGDDHNQQRPAKEVELCLRYQGCLEDSLSTATGERLFSVVYGNAGLLSPTQNPASYPLELHCQISESHLQLLWVYSDRVHARETIERLAWNYLEALRHIIAQCQTSDVGGYTPSDFPEADLSQATLNKLLARIQPGRKSSHQ